MWSTLQIPKASSWNTIGSAAPAVCANCVVCCVIVPLVQETYGFELLVVLQEEGQVLVGHIRVNVTAKRTVLILSRLPAAEGMLADLQTEVMELARV